MRGSAGTYVLDGSIVGIERGADGFRVTADATTWDGRLVLHGRRGDPGDGVQGAARRPPRARRRHGHERPRPGPHAVLGERLGAGDLLRREHHDRVARAREGRRRRQLELGERLPLQRARPRPAHRASGSGSSSRGRRSPGGRGRPAPPRRAGAWARALDPEGLPRARRVVRRATGSATRGSCRSSTSWTEAAAPDAAAVAVEMSANGTIYPAVYVRRGGELEEHELDPHPRARLRRRPVPPGRRAARPPAAQALVTECY